VALDAAEGYSPLGSIVAAFFLLSASGTVQLLQSWNSGSEFATTDMLTAAWNFLAGTILPEAAGLAIVALLDVGLVTISAVRRRRFGECSPGSKYASCRQSLSWPKS
jgi:hypothetical protein